MDQAREIAAPQRETDLTILQDRLRNITTRLCELSTATRIAVGGILGFQAAKDSEKTNDPEPCFIVIANADCERMESALVEIGEQIGRL